MLYYDKEIKKSIKKSHLSKNIAELFHHVFIALDKTRDLNLFEIKKIVIDNDDKNYYP